MYIYIYMAKTKKKRRDPEDMTIVRMIRAQGKKLKKPKTSKKKPTIFKKTTSWTKSARSGVPWEPRSSGERVIRHPVIEQQITAPKFRKLIYTAKQAEHVLCDGKNLNAYISKLIFGNKDTLIKRDWYDKPAKIQCGDMLPDPTTGNYDCWLCGCQLYPWMWAEDGDSGWGKKKKEGFIAKSTISAPMRAEIVAAHPNATKAKVRKMLLARWAAIPADDKKRMAIRWRTKHYCEVPGGGRCGGGVGCVLGGGDYGPACEHILPAFRAIFFSGKSDIQQIKLGGKIDKNAALPSDDRRIKNNYLWAHQLCNAIKGDAVLIMFNEKENEFQPDRQKCDYLSGRIGEKLRLVSRGGDMKCCCPRGLNGKGVCYPTTRQPHGASKIYQNEMEQQLVAINTEYHELTGMLGWKKGIQKFANYAIASIKLYAKDNSPLYKALDKRGGYKARKKYRSQSGGGYSCIDPEKLENFKNASQAWLEVLKDFSKHHHNDAAYYQLQIQYLLEKYNKDNNALENRFSDRDQIFNIIWSLYQSDPCISFGGGVELVNLMTIYFIGTKYGSENIRRAFFWWARVETKWLDDSSPGKIPPGVQQKDIPLFKYMCNELRIIYSKYDSCTSGSESFDSSRLPELVPLKNDLDDIFLSLAIDSEWQPGGSAAASTPQLFYLVQRYLFDEGGLADWWRRNPRTPPPAAGADDGGGGGGDESGATMMDTQGGGLRRRWRRRKTRRQKNRCYSNRKRNTRRRKKFRR